MARHAPALTPSELSRMTREETSYLVERVAEDVKAERKFHLELALGVMRASGARVSI